MNFLEASNVGSVPSTSRATTRATVWAEEALFGHRLWARETPWLLFLEFLNVAEAFLRAEPSTLFDPTAPEDMRSYAMRYRMGLRHILFNNEELSRISRSGYDDNAQWTAWFDSMQGAEVDGGFAYLKSRFPKFRDFAELVELIRQTTLETETNRRWSSRFIFPFGVDALYSDAIVKDAVPSPDYNNFGRTGEILYLMLSRSNRAGELRSHFAALLDPDLPKNRLVAKLAAPSDTKRDRLQVGETFLPYRQHPAFDRLADDWLAVLELGLPEQDAYAHLVPLGALHILLYQLETAAALADRMERPYLICEMIAPRREFVRQRSIISYQENDALSRMALEAEVDRAVAGDDWQEILSADISDAERSDLAAAALKERFSYGEDETRGMAPSDLVSQLRQAIEAKHEVSAGMVHSAYGRYIGLASRRGTNRMRYAPTDSLLKTLVVARVQKRVEFKRFLADLYRHYGLVFGEAEARQALPAASFDSSAFERNRSRFEARLGSMGLLNRLSDGCAYVINPFARQDND